MVGQNLVNQSIGMVHTLGTRVWRSIGHAPFPLHDHLFGVPLKGALHWIVGDDNSSEYICFLEKFESFSPPPQLEKMNTSMYLGVLADFLYLSNKTGSNHQEIWVMKDYKLKESWNKDYVFEVQSHSHLSPLKFLEDGRISILFGIVIVSNIVNYKHGWNDFRSLNIINTYGLMGKNFQKCAST